MDEFHRHMLRVTRAAAVAHDPELVPRLESASHLFAQLGNLLGIQTEKFFFHFDGLAALAQNFLAQGVTRRTGAVAFRQHAGSLPLSGGARRRSTPRTRLRRRPW